MDRPPSSCAFRPRCSCLALGVLLLAPGLASAAVVPGNVVLRETDVPPGAPAEVANIRAPFVEPDGTVAFTGSLLGDVQFVWRGNQIVWLDTDEMVVTLGTAEVSMGTSPSGSFVYSPSIDGNDGLYTDLGVFTVEGQAALGQPMGVLSTFHSRATMAANGAIWWVTGIDDTGSGATQARALMRSPSSQPGFAQVVLQTGDIVDGFAIDGASGIDFDYQVSRGDQHLIAVLLLDTGSTVDDGAIYVDGTVVAREASPTGQGDNWDNFDLVTINSAGHYAFSGDTDGAIATDEILAYDGSVVVREGDVLDGVGLGTSAGLRFIALDDNGRLVHAWSYAGGGETVFLSCDPSNAVASAQALLTTGDELDVDGDGLGDGIFVTDLLPTTGSPGRAMGDDGAIYLEVTLDEGGLTPEAMIRVVGRCCGNGVVDPGETCDDGNLVDGDGCSHTCQGSTCGDGMLDPGEACDDGNLLEGDDCRNDCSTPACGDGVLWVGVETCDDGDLDDTDECIGGTCTLADCGDGLLWDGVETCDDGNLDDTDDCPGSCVPAFCGDGFPHAGLEQCDDGNGDDTDDCLVGCVAAVCGDGVVHAGVEDCDDADLDNTDACLDTCDAASCGDGFVQAGVEMCDDGNLEDGDDCPSNCAPASCGDGFVLAGVEECDDGNADDTDGCLSTCMFPFCGDGFVFDGEEDCDDGNDDDTDLCPTTCEFAICGDGFVLAGVEECDDGNGDNLDGCLETCAAASCGDGFVQTGVEECDDGDDDDTDQCANDCTINGIDPDTSGGLDDTAGSTGASNGDSTTGIGSEDSGSDTGTDSDASAGAVDDSGCACRSGSGEPWRGAVLALVVLGLARPRRHRAGIGGRG